MRNRRRILQERAAACGNRAVGTLFRSALSFLWWQGNGGEFKNAHCSVMLSGAKRNRNISFPLTSDSSAPPHRGCAQNDAFLVSGRRDSLVNRTGLSRKPHGTSTRGSRVSHKRNAVRAGKGILLWQEEGWE